MGSSSSGNCYVLDSGREALVIEAGVSMKQVKTALDYNLSKVVGCLVSHRHNDHAKNIRDMVASGIHTLALSDVWEAKHVNPSGFAKVIEPNHGYKLGGFNVFVFEADHDVPCVGFVISHLDCGNILFLTDSCTCYSRFEGINHIMIECNYSYLHLEKAIQQGRTIESQRYRLMNSHMELCTCIDILEHHDLEPVQEIILLHMSEHNADEQFFVEHVTEATGKEVLVACPGLVVPMDLY